MSGKYPGVIISINKLSVRVSPICLSELVAMAAGGGLVSCVLILFQMASDVMNVSIHNCTIFVLGKSGKTIKFSANINF